MNISMGYVSWSNFAVIVDIWADAGSKTWISTFFQEFSHILLSFSLFLIITFPASWVFSFSFILVFSFYFVKHFACCQVLMSLHSQKYHKILFKKLLTIVGTRF